MTTLFPELMMKVAGLSKQSDDRVEVKVKGGTLKLPPTVGKNYRNYAGKSDNQLGNKDRKALVDQVSSHMTRRKQGVPYGTGSGQGQDWMAVKLRGKKGYHPPQPGWKR